MAWMSGSHSNSNLHYACKGIILQTHVGVRPSHESRLSINIPDSLAMTCASVLHLSRLAVSDVGPTRVPTFQKWPITKVSDYTTPAPSPRPRSTKVANGWVHVCGHFRTITHGD